METVEEELGKRLKAQVDGDAGIRSTLEEVALKGLEPYSAAMEFLDSRIEFKLRRHLEAPQADDRN